jgi:Reverse transcriptase (RNA-dependent DNA polymerase)
MKKEFLAMEPKRVWEIVLMSSMPPGRNIICNRWVYNKKDDGTLISRTVAQGFSQTPSQDFTDSHAPVMTDFAFRLALIGMKQRTGEFDIERRLFMDWFKLQDSGGRN